MVTHNSREHDVRNSCNLCGKYFSTKKYLQEHSTHVHKESDSEDDEDTFDINNDEVEQHQAEKRKHKRKKKKGNKTCTRTTKKIIYA